MPSPGDQFKQIADQMRQTAERIEKLRDPSTLAGAQAELERQVTLLEGHVAAMRHEIDGIPLRVMEIMREEVRNADR